MILNFEMFNAIVVFLMILLQIFALIYHRRFHASELYPNLWLPMEFCIGLLTSFFSPFFMGFFVLFWGIRTISVVKADFKTDLTKARFIFARRFCPSLLLCLAGFIFGYALLGFLGRIFAQDVYYPLLSCLGALSAILVYLLGRKLNPSAPLYLVTTFPYIGKKFPRMQNSVWV